jgi:hypothetical protein
MNEALQALENFMGNWSDSAERNKEAFLRLKSHLEDMDGVNLEFIPRPGVTYSLRVSHPNQRRRTLFVMVDVIEDTPRWLSVCFYGEMITDPDGRGDSVPQGLLGEDAVCFDIDRYEDGILQYVQARLDEAYRYASKG